MRTITVALTLAMTLTLTTGAQDISSLIAQASQPVVVDLAVGITVSGNSAEALASAGLASAIPTRMSVVSIATPTALSQRSAAERDLASRGPRIVEDLIEAEGNRPLGLWLPARDLLEGNRQTAEVRGLNIERILVSMGPDVLDSLLTLGSGSGAVAERAEGLHQALSELDVEILTSGGVRIEGQVVRLQGLEAAIESHALAQSARVTAPGDLPLNQIVPVLSALRAAGLELDIQATSSAVVTISDSEE